MSPNVKTSVTLLSLPVRPLSKFLLHMNAKYSKVGIIEVSLILHFSPSIERTDKGDNSYEQFLFNRCDDFQSKREIWC